MRFWWSPPPLMLCLPIECNHIINLWFKFRLLCSLGASINAWRLVLNGVITESLALVLPTIVALFSPIHVELVRMSSSLLVLPLFLYWRRPLSWNKPHVSRLLTSSSIDVGQIALPYPLVNIVLLLVLL